MGALQLNPGHDAPDVLAAIQENASRAGQILANLQALIRNEVSAPREHAPDVLVGEVVALMSPKLSAQAIKLEREIPQDLPKVRVVAVEIRQVLANLLLNASDALARQSENRKVEVSANHKGAWVWITVEDNGPGIPPGLQDKIFTPLFTTRPEGTGMGLAICRRVIAAHGGKIKAGRRRGGGARFEFSLPVAR